MVSTQFKNSIVKWDNFPQVGVNKNLKPQPWPWVFVVQGNEERRSGSSSSVPISQLEDLMRRRGVDAAWDALEDAWTVSDNKNLGKPRIGWTTGKVGPYNRYK